MMKTGDAEVGEDIKILKVLLNYTLVPRVFLMSFNSFLDVFQVYRMGAPRTIQPVHNESQSLYKAIFLKGKRFPILKM